MAISLKKGGNVSLTKVASEEPALSEGLKAVRVGLGWEKRVTDGSAFDLDVSVFSVGADGKVVNDNYFVFYGNLKSPCGAIVHNGDNRTGAGDGDDEVVDINLETLSTEVSRAVFGVTIHEAEVRGQNFGQVSNAYIRVYVQTAEGDKELARYDLGEDYSTETAMVFGEVYRHNGEWKMKAIGQGFAGGLEPLAKSYGVDVA